MSIIIVKELFKLSDIKKYLPWVYIERNCMTLELRYFRSRYTCILYVSLSKVVRARVCS